MGRAIVIVVAALFLVSACGGSVESGKVTLTLSDFAIKASQTSVRAGQITFVVKNVGKVEHEVAILKTELPAGQLPPRDNNPAKAQEPGNVGEIEDIAPGTSKEATFDLAPGNYVLICNVEGHYASGMHIAFTVRAK